MLEVCREQAELAGVSGLLDLRLGDYCEAARRRSLSQLVLCPFRAYLHLHSDDERLEALRAAYDLLAARTAASCSTCSRPAREDIEETHGRWLEREPGIFERADWDTRRRVLTLSLRGPDGETTMELAWVSQAEWRALLHAAGFSVDACYGWFDRRPWAGEEDSIWLATPSWRRLAP